MILGITAKMITDIGANLHKPWNAPTAITGTIDGVNTMFQLPSTPADINSLQVTLARQPQLLGIDFSYSVIVQTSPTSSMQLLPRPRLPGKDITHNINSQSRINK